MRMRARCTEMLSISESGRAKYTYSKMHGAWRVVATQTCECSRPMRVDVHDFTRRHVAHELEPEHVERDALGGEHPLGALRRFALAEHQRTDAVRIAEGQQPVADDHRDDGITAAATAIHGAHRREDVGGRDPRRADALQLRGEHVEQHFGIGAGVEVAAVFALDALRRARARW